MNGPYRTAASKSYGRYGLFARQDLARGSPIASEIQTSAIVDGLEWTACPHLRYLNHSCMPNAQVAWNNSHKVFALHAVDDIATGEEITVTYVGLYQDYGNRVRALRFDCRCPVCTVESDDELEESNIARRKIAANLELLKEFRGRHGGALENGAPMGVTAESGLPIAQDPENRRVWLAAEELLTLAALEGLSDIAIALAYDVLAVLGYVLGPVGTSGGPVLDGIEVKADAVFSLHHRDAQLESMTSCLGPLHPWAVACQAYVDDFRQRNGLSESPRERPWLKKYSAIHGRGLHARRKIKQCELILSEECELNLSETAWRTISLPVEHHSDSMLELLLSKSEPWQEHFMKVINDSMLQYSLPLATADDLRRAVDQG